eukprot:7936068-Karenia_brevis.AAC.1
MNLLVSTRPGRSFSTALALKSNVRWLGEGDERLDAWHVSSQMVLGRRRACTRLDIQMTSGASC